MQVLLTSLKLGTEIRSINLLTKECKSNFHKGNNAYIAELSRKVKFYRRG
jgi:hypothetical protein